MSEDGALEIADAVCAGARRAVEVAGEALSRFERADPVLCAVLQVWEEGALGEAVWDGRIAGGGMDVGRAADQMPTPALARLPNVIATPHVAGLTPQSIQHQALETVEQVRRILCGEAPPGAVNAERGSRLARLG